MGAFIFGIKKFGSLIFNSLVFWIRYSDPMRRIKRKQFSLIKKYSPGWVDGWMDVKAVVRIAYSNQKI